MGARMRGVKCLKVFGDSELIVNQVKGLHVIDNDTLKSYKNKVWDEIENFDAFNLIVSLEN